MNNTLPAVDDRHLPELARPGELSREQVDLLKKTICKGATDTELQLFLAVCSRTGLDPFARQIHAVRRREKGDDGQWRDSLQPMIGIDGFRLVADRTGRYVPGREPVLTADKTGCLVAATAYVKKLVAGEWHEIAATAYYEEYCQRTKEGNPNSMWAKMPRSQLAKCAESLALRRAFPAELSGLYTPEEMGHAPAEAVPAPSTVVNTETGEVIDVDAKPAEVNTKRRRMEDAYATLMLEAIDLECDKELVAGLTLVDLANVSDDLLKGAGRELQALTETRKQELADEKEFARKLQEKTRKEQEAAADAFDKE